MNFYVVISVINVTYAIILSLQVINNGANWQNIYDFLLVICSNHTSACIIQIILAFILICSLFILPILQVQTTNFYMLDVLQLH